MYKGLVYYGRLLIIIFCFKFRKRQRTTSDYIYHTLFVNGQDSDITLVALGKLIILEVDRSAFRSALPNAVFKGWKIKLSII